MANYRPKSLNELNNLYDKSMAAQNAIQKNGSAIADSDTEEVSKKASALAEEVPAVKEKTAAQIASDELAEELSKFIKNFGDNSHEANETSAPVQPVPVPITKTVKSAPAKPKTQKAKEESGDKKVIQKVSVPDAQAKEKKEKDNETRSLERDELFNDYMRIMNDEDEDGSPIKSKFKKKGKKDKHQRSPLDEDFESNIPEEKEDDEREAEEPKKEKREKKEKKSKDIPETAEEELKQEDAPDYEDGEDAEVVAPVRKKSKKQIVAQVFLMLILVLVLCLALAIGLFKVVVGVNTATPFLDKYYVFTAEQAYVDAGINDGDLIITQDKAVEENEALAFVDISTNTVNFGTRGSLIDNDSYMVHSDSGVALVSTTAMRGVVTTKIPILGDLVSTVMDNFIVVIAILVVLALILILILALAFRSSSNYEEEVFDEAEEENEEAVEDYGEEYEDDDDYGDYSEDNGYEGEDDAQKDYYSYDDADDLEPSEDDSLFSTID